MLLALLALPVASATPADADLLAAINAIRAQGCAGRQGVSAALRADPRLDRAAAALSDGRRLRAALADAGYGAGQSAMLEVSGADDSAILRALARRGCADIADPVFREAGIARRGGTAWIVLAAPLAPPARDQAAAVSARVLVLVNEARASPRRCGRKRFGVAAPLSLSGALEQAAQVHARDMARRSTLSHAGGDGSTHAERVTRAGYAWRVVGENIAAGQPTPEQVVAGWLRSPRHCANLMDPDFSDMGVGFAVEPGSTAIIYWAQVFAAPLR
ncbi:MAG TPA: CAP domain-containing protein [Steroidobacteraceae bacterium]|nr:CAP domain-containing protein [Steroidobacteraceae bacterium]